MVGMLHKTDVILELSDFGIELLDFLLEECVLIIHLVGHNLEFVGVTIMDLYGYFSFSIT
jgi:hypothetical protein